MKKTVILFAVLFFVSTFVFAQQRDQPFITVAIKGGANLTKITGTSYIDAYDFNYLLGGYVAFNFGGLLGVQPELLFSQTSATISKNFNDVYTQFGPAINSNPQLRYLSIPLLVNFGGYGFKFQFGPQYSILMNSNESLWANGQQAFKDGDFAFDIGVQLNLPLRLSASVRYIIGLSNINDVSNSDAWRSQAIQVAAGFRF